MKKVFWIVAVLVALVSSVASADINQDSGQENFTSGYPNGRYWLELDSDQKNVFLLGVRSGVGLMTNMVVAKARIANQAATADFVEKNAEWLRLQGFSATEISQQVSFIYSDAANLRIPVPFMLEVIIDKMKGVSQEDFQNSIDGLRKAFSVAS